MPRGLCPGQRHRSHRWRVPGFQDQHQDQHPGRHREAGRGCRLLRRRPSGENWTESGLYLGTAYALLGGPGRTLGGGDRLRAKSFPAPCVGSKGPSPTFPPLPAIVPRNSTPGPRVKLPRHPPRGPTPESGPCGAARDAQERPEFTPPGGRAPPSNQSMWATTRSSPICRRVAMRCTTLAPTMPATRTTPFLTTRTEKSIQVHWAIPCLPRALL